MKTGTSLITGASSGIGLHLAREFVRHGHNLVLIAPVEEELEQVAGELTREWGVSCRVLAKDLERADSPQEIFDALRDEENEIEILVNNAGHGFRGLSWELRLENDVSMVRLNIEAVLRLTKLFLPPMIRRGHGSILNTASIA